MYEQRAPEPARQGQDETERRPWRPDDLPIGADVAPSVDDRYVAIDRIDARVATLAVAPWPTVEPETGRLDFGPRSARRTLVASLKSVQTRIDRDRAASGQLVRPIRPGDVFLVRGFGVSPGRWSRVVDVTRSGRLAAKAALFSTAAPAPRASELRDYGLDRSLAGDRGPAAAAADQPDDTEPPPSGPIAYPAV